MKNQISFYLAITANLALLLVCLCWRGGGPIVFPMLAMLHIVLFLLNNIAGKRWGQVLVLGLTHIAATFLVHQQTGWLYLRYVSNDAEGQLVFMYGCLVGVVWTSILLIVSLVWFGLMVWYQAVTSAEMARDEARHGKAFKGLLERYFK